MVARLLGASTDWNGDQALIDACVRVRDAIADLEDTKHGLLQARAALSAVCQTSANAEIREWFGVMETHSL
jgi:hypothetical protein